MITIQSVGSEFRLFIDDVEILGIRSLSFNATMAEIPTLKLEMIPFEENIDKGEKND